MAKDLVVRNNVNMPIGWVRDFKDRKIATHYRKGYVGTYIFSSNLTLDKKGKIYCYGDGTQDLVRQADRE